MTVRGAQPRRSAIWSFVYPSMRSSAMCRGIRRRRGAASRRRNSSAAAAANSGVGPPPTQDREPPAPSRQPSDHLHVGNRRLRRARLRASVVLRVGLVPRPCRAATTTEQPPKIVPIGKLGKPYLQRRPRRKTMERTERGVFFVDRSADLSARWKLRPRESHQPANNAPRAAEPPPRRLPSARQAATDRPWVSARHPRPPSRSINVASIADALRVPKQLRNSLARRAANRTSTTERTPLFRHRVGPHIMAPAARRQWLRTPRRKAT